MCAAGGDWQKLSLKNRRGQMYQTKTSQQSSRHPKDQKKVWRRSSNNIWTKEYINKEKVKNEIKKLLLLDMHCMKCSRESCTLEGIHINCMIRFQVTIWSQSSKKQCGTGIKKDTLINEEPLVSPQSYNYLVFDQETNNTHGRMNKIFNKHCQSK